MCLNWSFNTFPKHIPLCFSYQIVSGPSEQGCGLGALRRPSLALLSCQSDWGREERPTLTPLLLVCMPRILSETVSGPGTWGQQRVGQRLVFCCSKAEKPCHRVFKLTEPAQRGAMVFVSLMDVSLVNAGLPQNTTSPAWVSVQGRRLGEKSAGWEHRNIFRFQLSVPVKGT